MVEREKTELLGQAQSILHPARDLVDGQSPTFRQHRLENADTDKALAQLVVEARHAVELVRQVARGLMPVAPGAHGLADALRGVAERAQRIRGVACVLQFDWRGAEAREN